MKISELFDKFQEEITADELRGELLLEGNCIVWTYNLDDVEEEIPMQMTSDDDEEMYYCFESASPEELLQEAYNYDFETIREFLDENDETDKWSFSEPEIGDNTISFKIF